MTNPRRRDEGPGVCGLILAITIAGLTGLGRAPDSEASLYRGYDGALASYVDSRGRVDYASLKEDRKELDLFVEKLRYVDLESWNPASRIAFWINVYNALTLRVIIDNYPIQSSFLRHWPIPKIVSARLMAPGTRFISGWQGAILPWIRSSIRFCASNSTSQESMWPWCVPRWGALSCVEKLTGRATRESVAGPGSPVVRDGSRFRVDIDSGVVYLSSIFSWFGSDFENRYGAAPGRFPRHSAAVGAVLSFALSFLSEDRRQYLQTQGFRIKYLSYD